MSELENDYARQLAAKDEEIKKLRAAVKAERKKKLLMIKISWAVFAVLFVLLIVVIGIKKSSRKALAIDFTEMEYSFSLESDEVSEMIKDNYLNYLRAAYIMIGGTYPDCDLVKIRSDVERNTYDVENFYIKDDESLMNYYIDGNKVAKAAIDVSSFQTSVNWDKVKAAGIDVAIVRVGYRGYGEAGRLVVDDNFDKHATGAAESGLSVGVYFFTEAMNYEEGVEEAEFVLQNIKDYNITEPVVIDTEYIQGADARANDISNTDRTDAIIGFCETIKKAGYTPMIYASRNWYVYNLEIERLTEYKWWLAHYSNQPDFPYQYTGWQYSSEGDLPGIAEAVDLNVWFE